MTKYIQTAAVVLCLCMVLWAAGLADGAAKKEEAENVTIWEENEAYLAIIDHEFRVKESYDE